MSKNTAATTPTYLLPVATFYVAMQLLSDITAGKLIVLAGQTVSITVLYFPLTFLLSDILTEVYGYASARRVLCLVLACSVLGSGISLLVTTMPPAPHFPSDQAYKEVFSIVPRIVVAGWLATWCGETINNYVLALMKVRTNGRHFWLRAIASTMVGQLANTSLFYGVGLSGELPAQLLLHSIITAWLFKVAIEAVCLPITTQIVKHLKQREGFDHFDTATDRNPLPLTINPARII